MSAGVRTLVIFRSASFNTTERKSYFINDCCFGDDAARWIAARLRGLGVEADDEPGQEDFGWFLRYRTPEGSYTLVLAYQPDEPVGQWIGTVERECGFIASMFGGRRKGVATAAVEALHQALSGCPEITSVAWHYDRAFTDGNEDGAASP